jgi:predicted nucleic acid-binding protein
VNVFVDTSGFYAVLDADDGNHKTAKAVWISLMDGPNNLHTSNYVLMETIALLQNRIGMGCVNVFTADILPVVSVFYVDEDTHRSAHHALLVAGRRNVSLVDIVSFEVMRRLHVNHAFCFDPHYGEQGFATLPRK